MVLFFGHALSGVTVKIADFRRLLFALWCHLGCVGLAWNATGPKLLSCQVILGRPVVFADFRRHHFPFSVAIAHRGNGSRLAWFPAVHAASAFASAEQEYVIFATLRSAASAPQS